MHDARPSLFIFAVLSAVLRSGFRDTLSKPIFEKQPFGINTATVAVTQHVYTMTKLICPGRAGPVFRLD